jgi:hypothetical protein
MTRTAGPLRSSQQLDGSAGCPGQTTVRLVPPDTGPLSGGPCRSPAIAAAAAAAAPDRSRAEVGHERAMRSWPLLVLALPAAVAVWSGWVGIGQMTGSARYGRCRGSGGPCISILPSPCRSVLRPTPPTLRAPGCPPVIRSRSGRAGSPTGPRSARSLEGRPARLVLSILIAFAGRNYPAWLAERPRGVSRRGGAGSTGSLHACIPGGRRCRP